MQSAETVLGVIRERGRQGLPLERLYRQLFNPQLFLLAYGRIYSNAGSMTPGVTPETVDGMSLAKIDAIIGAAPAEYLVQAGQRHMQAWYGGGRPGSESGLWCWQRLGHDGRLCCYV